MENSNVISIQEYKVNRKYYNIGLIIGALRAELGNGPGEWGGLGCVTSAALCRKR